MGGVSPGWLDVYIVIIVSALFQVHCLHRRALAVTQWYPERRCLTNTKELISRLPRGMSTAYRNSKYLIIILFVTALKHSIRELLDMKDVDGTKWCGELQSEARYADM